MSGANMLQKMVQNNNFPQDETPCYWAASGGHLEILQWLRNNDYP